VIADLKPYPAYKDSGLTWLEEVPSHWGRRRMKFLFSERTQKGFPDEPLLAATQTVALRECLCSADMYPISPLGGTLSGEYLETSVISYLTSRPSRDLITAANQQISHEWWERRHLDFELVVSAYVWVEAGAGDPHAARARLALLENIAQLPWSAEAEALAEVLCVQGALPTKARLDALHVASAAVAGVDFLLTWNCTHIANAETLPRIEAVCREQGFEPPRISTPLELLGLHRH